MTLPMRYAVNLETGCWEWCGEIGGNGYGRVWRDNKRIAAHRAYYEQEVGPIQAGAAADELSADLERGMFRAGRGIKSLCGELRPILKAIDGGTPTESASALLRFRRLRTMEPNLSSSGVKRELGKKLTAVLEGLV